METERVMNALTSHISSCPLVVRAVMKRLVVYCQTRWCDSILDPAAHQKQKHIRSSLHEHASVNTLVVGICFMKGLISNAIAAPTTYGILSALPTADVRNSLTMLKEVVARIGMRQIFVQGRFASLNPYIASSLVSLLYIQEQVLFNIPEALLCESELIDFDSPMVPTLTTLDSSEDQIDSAARTLYNHIRRNMSSLSEIGGLVKGIGGEPSCWEVLSHLIEPPRSADIKKGKKLEKVGDKRHSDKGAVTITGQLQIGIHAPYIEKSILSPAVNPLDAFSRFHSAFVGGTVADAAWEWEDSAISAADITVNDINWITNQHVFMEIKSSTTGYTTGQVRVRIEH